MKVLKFFGAVAVTSLFVAGANAEEYQGVLQVHSTATRSDVRAEAVAAAHLPNPYAEGALSGIPLATPSEIERTAVRAQAQAIARAGNLYGEEWSPGVSPRGSNLARIKVEQRDM